MGKLIRISKQINRSKQSTEKFDAASLEEDAQIIMFTGIRYERHLETDENENNNNASLSKKSSARTKNNSKLG
ncbi:MAG: hypothetical protein L3J15_06195 [Devosiaceae bacterium]|nr:hypothetical protein [Devosiaceae bacterium]